MFFEYLFPSPAIREVRAPSGSGFRSYKRLSVFFCFKGLVYNNDKRKLYFDKWWAMSDEWWVMSDEWWVMSDEWWVTGDEWWVMSDEWLVMSDERWAMSDERLVTSDEWWATMFVFVVVCCLLFICVVYSLYLFTTRMCCILFVVRMLLLGF